MSRKAKMLELEASKLNSEAKRLKEQVLKQLQMQGTKAMEQKLDDGKPLLVRVTLTEPESTVYHEDKILASLKKRKPDLYKRVLADPPPPSLDFGKLLHAVQDGEIPQPWVNRHSELVPRTPYITITLKEP